MKAARWRRQGCMGCGSKIGGLLLVVVLGGLLSLFPVAFGVGVSVGVPFMESNITAAGAIGAKGRVGGVLPSYTRERVAGNENFINSTSTLTVGAAQGISMFIVGRQDGAPVVDLYLALR